MQQARSLDAVITFGAYVRVGRDELGHGSSGRVFTCMRRGSEREHFAAKAIDLRHLRLKRTAERELKKLKREIDILRRVPMHKNLVRFFDSVEEGAWCFLILEYISGGDLFSTLTRKLPQPFNELETVFVLQQLIDGLEFLHSHDVIHRDLKLENILVVSTFKDTHGIMCFVKITDFGLSKVVGSGLSIAQSTVGSPRYIAPEVLATGTHDFRADLWSLGVLLYVLLAGKFPFNENPTFPQHVLDSTVNKLLVSIEAHEVLRGLMQLDRSQRLTFEALRQHPLLTSNADELAHRRPPSPAKRARVEFGPQVEAAAEPFQPETGGLEPVLLFSSEDSVRITLDMPAGQAAPGATATAANGNEGDSTAQLSPIVSIPD